MRNAQDLKEYIKLTWAVKTNRAGNISPCHIERTRQQLSRRAHQMVVLEIVILSIKVRIKLTDRFSDSEGLGKKKSFTCV